MTKTVLVTGASGFIGSAFMRIFGQNAEALGYRLIPAVRKPMGLKHEVCLDLEDKKLDKKLKKLGRMDAVVHLGAKIDFVCSLDDLIVPNVLATNRLAYWAKDIGAYFMLASTVMVYGSETERIAGGNPAILDTAYARSKLMAEDVVGSSGVRHLVMRLAGVYGNGGRYLWINRAIAQAQRGEIPTLYGDGKGKRNYIYVVDLVHMMVFWLKSQVIGTHLVAGSEAVSIADMIQGICDVFLDGQKPIMKDGDSSLDQIVEPSKECWHTSSFRDVLAHMKQWQGREKR